MAFRVRTWGAKNSVPRSKTRETCPSVTRMKFVLMRATGLGPRRGYRTLDSSTISLARAKTPCMFCSMREACSRRKKCVKCCQSCQRKERTGPAVESHVRQAGKPYGMVVVESKAQGSIGSTGAVKRRRERRHLGSSSADITVGRSIDQVDGRVGMSPQSACRVSTYSDSSHFICNP